CAHTGDGQPRWVIVEELSARGRPLCRGHSPQPAASGTAPVAPVQPHLTKSRPTARLPLPAATISCRLSGRDPMTSTVTRRALIAALLACLPAAAMAAFSPGPLPTRAQVVRDTLHGATIYGSYSWLEVKYAPEKRACVR